MTERQRRSVHRRVEKGEDELDVITDVMRNQLELHSDEEDDSDDDDDDNDNTDDKDNNA